MSLPDYPSVRVNFEAIERAHVSGVVAIDLSLMHACQEDGIDCAVIDIDGTVVYTGTSLPRKRELMVDTNEFGDGRRVVTVKTRHIEFGTFTQSTDIVVSNWWRLVQNMASPLSEGWFGTIDFLETASRSEGWDYQTSQSELFFWRSPASHADDRQFGVPPMGDPPLHDARLTAFVVPGTNL